MVLSAQFLAGVDQAELVAGFNRLRAAVYAEIVSAAREAIALEPPAQSAVLSRLRKKLEAEQALDHFSAPEQQQAADALAELEQQTHTTSQLPAARPEAAVWVTRQNVFVDRVASAWLIRRFIDPKARFKFVAPNGYVPSVDELRFDMFEGGYGHEGDRCTFETLIRAFGLEGDSALQQIAEIVHDLDIRDDKFGRTEAPGIRVLLEGLVARYASDAERIEHGRRIFDQLYTSFARNG